MPRVVSIELYSEPLTEEDNKCEECLVWESSVKTYLVEWDDGDSQYMKLCKECFEGYEHNDFDE